MGLFVILFFFAMFSIAAKRGFAASLDRTCSICFFIAAVIGIYNNKSSLVIWYLFSVALFEFAYRIDKPKDLVRLQELASRNEEKA